MFYPRLTCKVQDLANKFLAKFACAFILGEKQFDSYIVREIVVSRSSLNVWLFDFGVIVRYSF